MKTEMRSPNVTFRVINNTVALIGGEFVYHFINFLAGILVIRSLGGERYGQWSFIFVYLSFFEMFVKFGLDSILTRRLAQGREEAPLLLGNAVIFRCLLALLAVPLAVLLIKVLGYPVTVQEGVLIASFELFLGVSSIFETIFRVRLLMIYPALWNGARALLSLGLVVLTARYSPTVPHFILAYLTSGLAGLVGMGIFSRRFMPVVFRFDWAIMKTLIKESAPLVISGYLTLLYYRVDVFMLSRMKSFADVGYYSVATRFTESLTLIATSIMGSLFPLLSRAYQEDRGEFEALISKAFRILLLFGLPLALGGNLFARNLVVFLFGSEYAPSGVTLGILLWYTFFGFLSILLVNVLIVCGKQMIDAWISFFLVLANIGMNCVLIPHYSYNGAAVTTVAVEILGSAAMLLYLVRHPAVHLSISVRVLGPSLKVGAWFFLILLGVKKLISVSVPFYLLLGTAIYILLLFTMKLIRVRDVKEYLSSVFRATSEVQT